MTRFAARALGEVGSAPMDESVSVMELQSPLQVAGAIIRLQCACGFTLELREEDLQKLDLNLPEGGWIGKYLRADSCRLCGEQFLGLRLQEIPK